MTLPALVIYEDERGRFGPMTDRRAFFSALTGAVTNRVRIETALGQMACAVIVPGRLEAVQRLRETDARVNEPLRRAEPITFRAADEARRRWSVVAIPGDGGVLLVNGRWAGLPAAGARLVRELPFGQVLRQEGDGHVVAAHLAVDAAQRWVDSSFDDGALPGDAHFVALPGRWLMSRPWHILDHLEETVAHDLSSGRVDPSAKVHPTAVMEESTGPVVIAEQAVVGAFCVLEGPVFVGAGSIVQPHTLLRPRAIVGPGCKVAGEVSFSIIQGRTNKAHYGYLGHSLIGEWCNLGAGTTVSNLKNTYGMVRVQLEAGVPGEETGRAFHGPIIGDFTRTAIGTRIFSGSCLGTGTLYAGAGFAPKFTAAGAFITDKDNAIHSPEKLIATIRVMFARRQMELPAAEEALLRRLLEH